MSTPMQPDTGDVLQEEAPESYQAIPVKVEEVATPVRVQALPRKSASTFTKTVGTVPFQLLRADHRRGRALLTSSDPFLVAFSEASCQSEGSMAAWPADHPLELSATVEVWAMVPVDTATISVITERWADGE